MSDGPGYEHAALMERLKKLTHNARGRLVEEVYHNDSDAVVRALGGGFKKETEIRTQGGHVMIILRGKNNRVAVVTSSSGIVCGKIRIFEREERES